MQFKYIQKLLYITCLSLMITACGFQLRGANTLAPEIQVLYVKSNNPYGEFEARLKKALRNTKVILVNSPQSAPITLQIIQTNLNYFTSAIATSSQASVYTVIYTATITITTPNGHILVGPKNVSSIDYFTLYSSEVLGSTNQIEIISEQLQEDVIIKIFDILNSPQVKQAITKISR